MKVVFNSINRLLDASFGLRIQPSSNARLSSTREALLNNKRCELLVDVGANDGDWAARIRKVGFKGLIESFEPTEIFEKLKKRAKDDEKWRVNKLALSDFSGVAKIHLGSNDFLSSSLMAPTGVLEANPGIIFEDSVSVDVSTLDSHFSSLRERNIYLKLDVQGSEFSILKGGKNFLQHCFAIEFESAIYPQYEGEQTHYFIANWLQERGFVPKQVVVTHWDSALQTIAIDSIFVRGE
jgi:FkbM family methyltransferase